MSFKLGDIIIDRIQMGYAESLKGEPLYVLSQLADSTIEISAESKDAKDQRGTIVKRFWQGKTGTYTANNAMINTNVMGANSGTGVEEASKENKIKMPKIITVKAGTESIVLEDAIEGTIKVNAYENNGSMGKAYTQAEAADKDKFGYVTGTKTLSLPKPTEDEDIKKFVIKYDREVEEGVAVRNKADKFPSTIRLTLKALCVDPCSVDTLRACYIVLPSFQVSPEISLQLTTDAQLEYKGDLQVAYCSDDKSLYEFYMADDAEKEE